jgi:hypothetical protein
MGVWRDPSSERSHELKKRARFEQRSEIEHNERQWALGAAKNDSCLLTTAG